MKYKISQKIIFIVLLVILFFGSIATGTVYFQTKNILVEKQRQNLSVVISSESELIANNFDYSQKLVLTVSNQLPLQEYLSQTSPASQDSDILALLNSYNLNQNYSAIYLMDTNGDTLVSTDSSFVGKNYSFRPYFQMAQASQVYTYVAIGVTSKDPGYYFSTLIKDSSDQKIGVLVFKLKPDIIHQTIHQEQDLSDNIFIHNTYIIDQRGVIIYSTNPEKIFKSLGQLSQSSLQIIKDSNIYAGLEIKPLTYQPIQDQLSTVGQETSIFNFYDQYDQKEELLLIKQISSYPFYFMIETELENTLANANSIALTISLFVALAALFAFIIIFLSLKKILAPIKTITKVSQDIIAGQLNQRVSVKTNDEFQILADNFNQVTDTLVKTNQGIQKKIDEKTADLQKINRYMVNREIKMIELKKQIKTLKKK